ncbi:MAG: hypothetical protein H9W80_13135 [Enterococcus sp.]|nr:hypothetical protein [Enterococcus sp.]
MSHMVSLKMDCNTLDCLQLAVSNLREDITEGRLALSEDMADDFITELGQLEYLVSVAEEELKTHA